MRAVDEEPELDHRGVPGDVHHVVLGPDIAGAGLLTRPESGDSLVSGHRDDPVVLPHLHHEVRVESLSGQLRVLEGMHPLDVALLDHPLDLLLLGGALGVSGYGKGKAGVPTDQGRTAIHIG